MKTTGGNRGNKDFGLKDVLEIFNMSREQLNHWTRLKYIQPSIIKAQGSRVIRSYDLLDVYSVGLFKHLVENTRIPREVAADFVKEWVKFARKTRKYVIYDNDYLVFSRVRNKVTVLPFCSKPTEPGNEELSKMSCFIDISQLLEGIDYDEAIIVNYKKIKEFVDARI